MFDWLKVVAARVRGLVSRRDFEQDFEQELDAHLALLTEENIRRGLSPEEARRAARLRLGGVTQLRETHRELHGLPWIETLAQDIRYALRVLGKNPGFTVVAVLVLGVGICASVAIFAFVDAALIKPLPYPNPARLVAVTESVAMFPRANLSYPDYLDWKRLNKVFTSLDAWAGTGYLMKTPAGTEPVMGARVSDGFFRTLGITPALGRDFYAGEDLPSAPNAVMLSYTAWQKWFGGRRQVVGQAVTLSGVSYNIIGVLPRDFQFAPRGGAEIWATLHASDSCALRRSCHNLDGIARLRDGVSVQAALADMTSIAQQLEKQYSDSNRGQGASVVPLSEAIVGDIRPILLVLLGGAGLLLLIACVNVTSLLLARSESRRREIAVRGALGASFARLVRQFATEAFVLVVAGSVLGLLSAGWAMQLLARLIPPYMTDEMPYLRDLGLNFHVVAFACAIALLAGALFAATPSLRLSVSEMREGLVEGGRGATGALWRRFGANLVVVELAIAMVLLVGAGLLGKSVYRLLHVELGFEPDHLAALYVVVPEVRYGKDPQVVALGRQIVSGIASLPGIKSAGIASRIPLSGNGNTDWIRFVGRPYSGEHNEVNQRDVSSGYFTTLQAKLLRGRYFTDAEDASKPHVAIINRAFQRKYFPPGEDPVGKQIGDTDLSPKSIKEIIGVVDDIREGSLDSDVWPAEYLPINQSPDTFFAVVARTSQAEASVLPALAAAIHQIDADIGTASEQTMTQRANDSETAYLHRSSAWLVAGFAALALLLGVVGLYGVIAYSVSQRTREIGVRVALGAQSSSVYRLVLKEAGWLAALGIFLGLVCSVAAATLMRKLLFGTQATDVPTLAAVAAVLAVSALAASYIPARRAVKVDPVVALRYE
ncbi:MAG TPA: ABC transporter permease [Terriglobia bacterium]|nr:ABC transporter permease [Terriglobia bacterium]